MSAPQNNLILFTPGTVIQSAQVNQNFNDIVGLSGGAIGSQLQTLLSNNFSGFVQSGGIITTASGLTVNMSSAYIVVAGLTYYMPAQAFTVTASKDVYIDFVPGTIPSYQATNVTNGAASPALYATNAKRMAKIVSGASSISSITQGGLDSLYNAIYVPPNIKSVSNTSLVTPGNADQNLATSGLQFTTTVPVQTTALVTVVLGINSTTDFEFHPEIWLDGALYYTLNVAAAQASASNRGVVRSVTYGVLLTPGTHTLSAGVFLSSGTSMSLPIGAGTLSSIIYGQVTA